MRAFNPTCGQWWNPFGWVTRRPAITISRSAPSFHPPLALSGCGWARLYGEAAGGPASEELRAIYVEPILERIGQRLQIALRNSLNPIGQPTPERYRLRTTLATYLTNLGIESQPYRPRSPRRNRRWSRRWWMQTRSLPSQTNS